MADMQDDTGPKALNSQVAHRVIKFRAWQKESSLDRKPGMYKVMDIVWYPENDKTPAGDTGEVFFDDGSASSEYIEDVELMQYTGLHDKNGVEIYEGDVVRIENGKSYRIGFRNASFEAYLLDLDQDVTYASASYVASERHKGEVIGNIYENPELLK